MRISLVLFALQMSLATAWAQPAQSTQFPQLPQCTAVAGWQQQGPNRTFETDSLFEYMDGNSEGYFLYGFVVMKGITCQSGDRTMVIDISEMSDPEHAYGMFTATVDRRRPIEQIGMAGQVTPRRAMFAKDKYYVELAADPEGDHTAAIRAYMAILEKNVSGRTTLPEALDWFPTEGLVAGAVRLVPESVLGIRLLRSGYVGQYEFGNAFVVHESSPETAGQVMEKLKARFGQTTPAQIADEGFTGTDKYLGGMCVFRKGSYLGGFSGLKGGHDGVAEAITLAAGLK
jgi:hypothetical protein